VPRNTHAGLVHEADRSGTQDWRHNQLGHSLASISLSGTKLHPPHKSVLYFHRNSKRFTNYWCFKSKLVNVLPSQLLLPCGFRTPLTTVVKAPADSAAELDVFFSARRLGRVVIHPALGHRVFFFLLFFSFLFGQAGTLKFGDEMDPENKSGGVHQPVIRIPSIPWGDELRLVRKSQVKLSASYSPTD
jgi:hypothetical protein